MPLTVTEDRTFTAQYTPIDYEIEYIMNGGTNHVDNPDTYTIEDAVTLKDPTKTGYTFAGWTPTDNIPLGSTGKKTFTATWKENFTITFNEGAHGSITTQRIFEVPNGDPFPTPPGVTADSGYTFDGWPTMPLTVTEDRTFTAQYTPIDYEIEYIMNGGTNHVDNPDTYTIEDAVTLKDPTKTGYTFAGWTPTDNIPLGSTGKKTFTATWKENFTITFNEGAHGSITTQRIFEVPNGDPFPTPPGVTADSGYTFDGWPTMPLTVTEDRTFTAQYTPIDYEIEYIMNGGTNHVDNPDTYTIEDAVTLKDPTKTGYTFAGWTPTDNIPLGSTGKKTFTATWKENFTITFNEGAHGSITTQRIFEVPNGDPFPTPPGVTADSGYTFDGWPTMPLTVTEDRTFTAQYTPIDYEIEYIMNGGTNHVDNPDTYTIEDAGHAQRPDEDRVHVRRLDADG